MTNSPEGPQNPRAGAAAARTSQRTGVVRRWCLAASSSSSRLPRTDPSNTPIQARRRSNHEAMDAGGDWRAQLQPERRSKIVNKIVLTLRKHLPVQVPEGQGLVELQRIAVRFEDKVYAAATTQAEYLRKISLKLLSMWSYTNTQQNPGPGSSTKGKKQKKLRCHFCKKGGHLKKDCLKRKLWFEKKGVAYDPTHKRTKAHENKNEGTVLKESGIAE
ncbi:uncharacterized protein LOC110436815 isoform X2 [Sorghum bicolor]|nr:uncharacterized protein LOC110436815 isoform X2 [Sorghum bicolor]|eukprot:XP_021320025.1 uncharacterized protein LOC110436815 isoform X2 [Sorghum bicolor]